MREREKAWQALMRRERQLRLIADALPVMIAYVAADGRVRFLNLASEEWFGRPRVELEGGMTVSLRLPVAPAVTPTTAAPHATSAPEAPTGAS